MKIHAVQEVAFVRGLFLDVGKLTWETIFEVIADITKTVFGPTCLLTRNIEF